jgi:mannose-6-phosphate isomerase-like protein (cupin superfamily)
VESAVRTVVHPREVDPSEPGGADVRVTFGRHNGCERLEQRVISVRGRYDEPALDGRQVVLYVASGLGSLVVDGEEHPLEPDAGAFVAPGESFALVAAAGELNVVAVYTPADGAPPDDRRKIVVRFGEQPELDASEERSFRLLVGEAAGCADVTQFVGIVQPSKAPFHSHPYDEVGYIIEGEGVAHVDGVATPLTSGSCFHLAPGQVHCIENTGPGAMRILGVFHPAGSPANRAYPDNNHADRAS